MFIGKKDKYGITYYTFKDLFKIHRLSIFFRYGFYISIVLWMCGMCFAMFSKVSGDMKATVIVVTLFVYIFFVVGKCTIESKFGKKSWKGELKK